MYNNRRIAIPRLSLYKPERGNDYHFLDKQIQEMFTIGGTDINIHKFLGAVNPDEGEGTADQPTYDAVKETNLLVPLVVRLAGTNVELGKDILKKSNLKIISANNLSDAAKKIVEATK